MRFSHLFFWLVIPFFLMGCPEVDPRTLCDGDDNCHEGYACDASTKVCLRSCSVNSDCIDKSQLCDVSVCRTACISADDCDPAYQCIKDTNAAVDDPGICKDE